MVEGQVSKLKLIKRQGYGRAGFPLLRKRVLHAFLEGRPLFIKYDPLSTSIPFSSRAGGGISMGHPKETRATFARVRTSSHLGSEERASSVQKSLEGEPLISLKNSSRVVSFAICSCESFK